MQVLIKKKSIYQGFRFFIILSLLGFGIVFYITATKETLHAISFLYWPYFAIALLLFGIDLLVGVLRIYIFVRKTEKQVRFWDCCRANLAGTFMAVATPFQTGGGMAQLYMLNRSGVSWSAGLSIGALNYLATLSIMLISAIILIFSSLQETINFPIKVIFRVSLFVFYLLFLGLIIFLIRPTWVSHITRFLFRLSGRIWREKNKSLLACQKKIDEVINKYHSYLFLHWHKSKFTLLFALFLTFVIYFNKYLIAFVVLKGIGLSINFLQLLSILMLIIFLTYFAPTPGGSLISETSAAAMMSFLVPSYLLPIFIVLWRVFTLYIAGVLGGIVFIHEIGSTS